MSDHEVNLKILFSDLERSGTINRKQRDELLEYCLAQGIEVKVHYPVPIYQQPALSYLGLKKGDYPVTDAHTHKIITFPCDQHLSQKEMNFVIQTVTDFYQKTP